MCQGCPWLEAYKSHCIKLSSWSLDCLWRPQEVGDFRTMGYLLRRAANREWNQPKRKKYVSVKKAERSWRSEEHFDIRLGDEEFGVCPAVFQFCFGPVYPHYVPFPVFWNTNVCFVPLYAGNMWFVCFLLLLLFVFNRGLQLRCCGTMILYPVKICHLYWFNKVLIDQ